MNLSAQCGRTIDALLFDHNNLL